MKKYTYDFNFILENARCRDYLAFLILVLFITLIFALLITKELKIFQVLLIVSPFLLVTICGTLEYYQIKWYLIEAKQYREEDNYEDAFEIYDNILHEHPGLEYVLDEYNDAKNEYKNKGGFKNE